MRVKILNTVLAFETSWTINVESLDPKVLFHPFEEQLHLPALFVD
jgi:hypothetical protein